MFLTFFSFLMSVVWSSVLVILMFFLRKNKYFVKGFGVLSVSLLYVFCAIRMLVPIEFDATVEVSAPIFNDMAMNVAYKSVEVGTSKIDVVAILLILWGLGTLVSLAVFFIRYFKNMRAIEKYERVRDDTLEKKLKQVKERLGKNLEVSIFYCPEIAVPMGVGVVKRKILMPKGTYTDEELEHVIGHEYTHFLNGDLTVKMLIKIFCCVFWWNPIFYLLRKDLSQVLEIKCDLTMTEGFDKAEKVKYMKVIMNVLKRARGKTTSSLEPAVAAQMTTQRAEKELEERFHYLIVAPEAKTGGSWQKPLWTLLFALLFVLSYMFVLQSQFDPPIEDMYTSESVIEVTAQNAIILEYKDGSYSILNPDGSVHKFTNPDIARTLCEKEGFPFRREGDFADGTDKDYLLERKNGSYMFMTSSKEGFTIPAESYEVLKKFFRSAKEESVAGDWVGAYLLEKLDGTFSLVEEDGTQHAVSADTFEVMKDFYEVRKAESQAVTKENTYIELGANGKYYLHTDGVETGEISEEGAKMLIEEGFSVVDNYS